MVHDAKQNHLIFGTLRNFKCISRIGPKILSLLLKKRVSVMMVVYVWYCMGLN